MTWKNHLGVLRISLSWQNSVTQRWSQILWLVGIIIKSRQEEISVSCLQPLATLGRCIVLSSHCDLLRFFRVQICIGRVSIPSQGHPSHGHPVPADSWHYHVALRFAHPHTQTYMYSHDFVFVFDFLCQTNSIRVPCSVNISTEVICV